MAVAQADQAAGLLQEARQLGVLDLQRGEAGGFELVLEPVGRLGAIA